MAVLFGLLMEHSSSNQRTLLAALPGSSDKEKLGTLLHHARDFTTFYVTLTRKIAEAGRRREGGDEDEEADVQASSGNSGPAFKDTMGEAVANGVIAFLSRLRDHGVR